jgi:hypothetical protein
MPRRVPISVLKSPHDAAILEEVDAARCLSEIERVGPKRNSFAKLARLVHRVYEKGYWKREGHRRFEDWGRKALDKGIATIYLYVNVIKYLPDLTDTEINKLGFNTCDYLVKLARKNGSLDSSWIEKARKWDSEDLKLAVERELRKNSGTGEFGELLNPCFRGLVHAPISEQGVVYLFGMVSNELGFIVEKVQRSYPDCIAKGRSARKPGRWLPVRIEFEYKSSDFDHPPEGSDLIVCWEDDLRLKGRKAPLPVLELKSQIRKLPAGQNLVQPHLEESHCPRILS